MTSHAVSDEALDIIFRDAHTQNKWTDKPVSNALLMAVYDLMRWGPTSAKAAPAVAIIGTDLDFPGHFPRLFPNNPKMKDVFTGKEEFTKVFGLRNSSLQ